ncbi:MAG: phosphatase PAP2 family protein [Acidimicrobiales bacterium]
MIAPALLRSSLLAGVGARRVRADSRARRPRRIRWWTELCLASAGYGVYAFIRNTQGRAQSVNAYTRAVNNSAHVVSAEKHLGVYHEKAVQHLALKVPLLMQGFDTFWSLAYLFATVGVFIWLIRWQPERYRRLRSAFVLATALGLVVFAFYPAVPPRMLPEQFGFVDTWARIGGIGMKNPPRLEQISDPFAAMPSLHVAWAAWCALAVAPACRRWWAKALAWSYASLTIVAVIATGNHFLLDAINGIALAVGSVVVVDQGARLRQRWWLRKGPRLAWADLGLAEAMAPVLAVSDSSVAA